MPSDSIAPPNPRTCRHCGHTGVHELGCPHHDMDLTPSKTPGLGMFCVLDRPKGKTDWHYFNLYPKENMAQKAADTINDYKDSNREAVVVPVFIPFPKGPDGPY